MNQRLTGGGVTLKEPKTRVIAKAAHKDSHIFFHYAQSLSQPYEERLRDLGLQRTVTAFRKLSGQYNIHFANEVFEFIKSHSPCCVSAMDISGFFDDLDHALLKSAWAQILDVQLLPDDHFAVFKAITHFCRVNGERLKEVLQRDIPVDERVGHRLCTSSQFRNVVRGPLAFSNNNNGIGIPQGSPISALLANIYMLDFDVAVNEFVTREGGMYRRYCDDILVVLPNRELRLQVGAIIHAQLQRLGLIVQAEKTEEFDFPPQDQCPIRSKPLQFLGFTFDGKNKRIRPASVAKFYSRMRRGVVRAKMIRERVDRMNGLTSPSQLKTRQLYVRYSYIGRHNFIAYASKSANIMNDVGIKKQVKNHWKKLQVEIAKPLIRRQHP